LQGPFRDPAFWGFAAVALVFPLGIGLLANGAPVYLASRGLDDRTIGMVLAVNGMLLGALSLPANRALEKRGPFLLLPLAALFVAASLGALGISASAWAFFAAVLVFSAGELLFSSALPTAVSRLSPPDRRGAYQGAWSMVYSLMVGAALAVLSLLRASLDWGSTWLLLGGFAIVAGFALLLARRAFSATIAARSAAQGATPAAHGTRPPT
jgi:MFS family permease